MAFLVFTIISTFLGQALNGKRCNRPGAQDGYSCEEGQKV